MIFTGGIASGAPGGGCIPDGVGVVDSLCWPEGSAPPVLAALAATDMFVPVVVLSGSPSAAVGGVLGPGPDCTVDCPGLSPAGSGSSFAHGESVMIWSASFIVHVWKLFSQTAEFPPIATPMAIAASTTGLTVTSFSRK
jgi:hypothetical protein